MPSPAALVLAASAGACAIAKARTHHAYGQNNRIKSMFSRSAHGQTLLTIAQRWGPETLKL